MPTLSTEHLAELIARKHECLLALRDLGRRQRALVEEEELGQLFKLLGTKQRLLTMLQEVERGLEPHRAEHPEHRRWASPEQRARCAQLAEECPALLAEIVAEEKASETRLRERRDLTETQLNSARSAGIARQAYVSQSGLSAGRLDLTAD